MLSSIDRKHMQKGLRTAEFLTELYDKSEKGEIPKINQIWQSMELPDYLSNPAYRDSRSNEIVQTTENGDFEVVIVFPDGTEVHESDLIKFTVGGRGKSCNPIGDKRPRFIMVESCNTDTDHHVKMVRDHCGKKSCPDCSAYQMEFDSVENSIKIMTGAKFAIRSKRSDNLLLQHVAVSPPKEFYHNFLTLDGFIEMRKYAIKVAMEAGIKGGVIFFHPFRQNGPDLDGDVPQEYGEESENDGNPTHARWSPHFHVVGFGFVKPASRDFVESHKGWVYKSLRTGANRLKTAVDVMAVMRYVNSHAGIIADDSPSKPTIKGLTWFGLCNSAVLGKVGEVSIHEEELCLKCGDNIVSHMVHGFNNELERIGNLYKKQSYPIYSDSAHKNQLREILEEYRGSPIEALQFIEEHPEMGACYLTSKELDRRLSTPTVIYAEIDKSPHIPDVYASIKVKYPRERKKLCPHCSGSGSGPRFVSRPDPIPENYPDLIPYIDFMLPPEVDLT